MTAVGPTLSSVTRSTRGPAVVVALLVLVTALLALLGGTRPGGALDPRAYDPSGSHALAALLERDGTRVRVVRSAGEALAGAGPSATVLLPFPDGLSDRELRRLAPAPGGLVAVGAGPNAVAALGLPVTVEGGRLTGVRRPACALPLALRAGTVRLGGPGYRSPVGTSCYASGGLAGLVVLPAGRVLLSSGDPLTNERLADEGDAALALGLLGGADEVRWLLPSGTAAPVGGRRSLTDLLPSWVGLAALQLGIAVVLLALARGRRLGRVVVEPLPVVVRAAEAVEGRGRLYRATRARGAAAEALRAASRDAAGRRLGLPPSGAGLVELAAVRTGRRAADLEALLYGPVPVDDAALVRLAADLTRFDSEVAAP